MFLEGVDDVSKGGMGLKRVEAGRAPGRSFTP